MADVFIAPKGTLSTGDKRALRKAGIVVVEADPDSVKFIRANEEVSGSDMLWAALDALCSQDGNSYGEARLQRARLARNLLEVVMNKRSAPKDGADS